MTAAGKPIRELDGPRFDTLEGFWDDDILRGGFGTPEGGFVLHSETLFDTHLG